MAVEKIYEGMDAETVKAVKQAIKNSGVKLVDLADGSYVDSNKYNTLETKYNELKEAPNPLEDKVKELKANNTTALQAERDKISNVVKQLAIDKEISSLGLTNELTILGVKSSIKTDDIQLNDDYTIKSGLNEQIARLKDTYKTAFETPQVVSTGQSIQTSNINGSKVGRVYSSLSEINSMSQEEVQADYDNIISQIPNLK